MESRILFSVFFILPAVALLASGSLAQFEQIYVPDSSALSAYPADLSAQTASIADSSALSAYPADLSAQTASIADSSALSAYPADLSAQTASIVDSSALSAYPADLSAQTASIADSSALSAYPVGSSALNASAADSSAQTAQVDSSKLRELVYARDVEYYFGNPILTGGRGCIVCSTYNPEGDYLPSASTNIVNPEGEYSKPGLDIGTEQKDKKMKANPTLSNTNQQSSNWHGARSFIPEGSTNIYVSGHQMSLATYQNTYQNSSNLDLWIETSQGWTQYASISPQSEVSLVAYTSTGGQGELYELFPSASDQGTYVRIIYDLSPGYNQLKFIADASDRHILFFAVDNELSSPVILNMGSASTLGTSSAPVSASRTKDSILSLGKSSKRYSSEQ